MHYGLLRYCPSISSGKMKITLLLLFADHLTPISLLFVKCSTDDCNGDEDLNLTQKISRSTFSLSFVLKYKLYYRLA